MILKGKLKKKLIVAKKQNWKSITGSGVHSAERAHTPAKLWERILLSRDKEEALAKIECELQYWSPFLLDKCKLRLERLQEVQKQLHKILVRAKDQPLLTSKTNKVERRERSRENKARAAAKLELTIEKELVDRLRQGVYGDMYNLHQKAFESVLESHGKAMKLSENEDSNAEEEYEFVEGDDEELSDSCEYEFAAEEEAEVEEELHDIEEMPAAVKRKRSGPFVEIEYETEPAQVPHQRK